MLKKKNQWKYFFLGICISCCFIFFIGCRGETYGVDYCGEKDFYVGAKDFYQPGTKVKLYYDLIATDTDYTFYLNQEPLHAVYEEGKGFCIEFVMPQQDVVLSCQTKNTMEYIPEEEKEIDVIALLEEALLNTDSICGVIYCGKVEEGQGSLSKDREAVDEILRKGGYGKNYDFIRELPKKRIIELENGKELYYIYPYDREAQITVSQCIYQEKEEEPEVGKVLYQSKKGEPILIRCNQKEGKSDILIQLVTKYGEELKWSPSINPKDGTVVVPDKFPFVLDATEPVE